MTKRTYRWLTASLAVLALAADQGTKYGMFRSLYDGSTRVEREVVPGWFKFTAEYDPAGEFCDCGFAALQTANAPVMPRVNYGALFGLGGEHKATANAVFAGISLLAALGIVAWVGFRGAAIDAWLSAALGLILGGTVGNFYDRLVFHGVRDFLYFYKIEWPVFNVADCCLVAGAGMLLVHAFFVPSPPTTPAPPVPTPVATPGERSA